jgi:hypothetical protein
MAKPEKKLDYKIVDTALYFGATIKQLQFLLEKNGLELHARTIQRAITRDKGRTFEEYRSFHEGGLQLKLIQKAVEMALAGNVAILIFLLKNKCGYSDKVETKMVEVSKEDTKILIKEAQELVEKMQ